LRKIKGVFKLRFFAAALVVVTGCSSASRRANTPDYDERVPVDTKAPIEIEHISETPHLAPPPGTVSETNRQPANHLVNGWIPLRKWSDDHKAGPVQQLSSGTVPTFALKAANGLLIIRAYTLVAFWNGMEFHLGFAPQMLNGQPVIHALDFAKNIEPLLRPLALPEKSNRLIVIDAGHGGSNLGTKSVLNGAYEKEFALDWARRLAPILETNGWRVLLTRNSDVDLSLSNRVTFADANKANLFVSLHFNAAPSPSDHDESGVETFCVTPVGMPSTLKREYEDDTTLTFPNNRFDSENFQYAVQVQRAVLKMTGARDHGVRRARFMTVLRGQNCPAVLVEGGYLSNPREAKRIADPAYRQKLAEAVASALVERPALHPPSQSSGATNSPPSAAEPKTTPTNSVPPL
jgi:N-acetylmuramoyl-L-alanine amidase